MTHPYFVPQIGSPDTPQILDPASIDWRGGFLLRSTNWLGDAVMALPASFRLCEQLPPGVPCHVLCLDNLRSFWACVPWVDRVIPFRGRRLSQPDDLQAVTNLDCGVAFVLPNSFGSAWDLWRTHIPIRIGRRGRGRALFLTHHLPEYRRQAGEDRYHQARHYLELAAALGCTDWDLTIPALITEISATRQRELIDPTASTLVVAPGAAFGPAKQWPDRHFRTVAEWWLANHGPVLAVGTADERDRCENVIADLPGAANLAGKTDLQELVYILTQARCVVVNDSGAMHLAAAVGADGVACFGSTDPVATGPVGGRWIVIYHDLACAPCLQRTCPRRENLYECLIGIQPETVIDALRQLLNN